MKTLRKFFGLFIIVICFITLTSCGETEKTKIIIGDDGNWYIDGVDTGYSSVGKDGVDGKSAYEIAVEKGYSGTVDEWIAELKNSDGKLNVYDKDSNQRIESEIEIVSGKLLLVIKETKTVVTEYGTVNEVAYENKTFKEIFEDSNYAPICMDSYNASLCTYSDYSGKTTIQSEVYNTPSSAMYVEGTTSQQAKSNVALTGEFYISSKIKCTRYEAGYLGIVFGTDSSKYEDTTMQFELDEFITCSSIQTLSSAYIFIGSAISANLDGYIDDPVIIDLSMFNEKPTKTLLDNLYEKYIGIKSGKTKPDIQTEIVTTEKVFYLAEEEQRFNDVKAKSTFMAYMNQKAKDIGMLNTNFVDAAGFYNQTTAYDLLRLGVYACSYDEIVDAWHKNSYIITVTGNKPRSESITTTVAGSQLENYYFLFGGKTGTVTGYVNLMAIVEGPDERLFVVVVLGCEGNRFETAKQAMDIAVQKYNDPNFDTSGYKLACKSAAVCLVPKNNTKAYTDYNLNILFSQNLKNLASPASITKVMTSICMLDFVSDINESFMILESDITSGSGNIFYAGDIITYKEALHAMMLPSSNTCAEATATAVGHKILYYNSK